MNFSSEPHSFSPARSPVVIQPTGFTLRNPALIPQRQWVYGAHYIRRFVTATIANGGVGKSSLALVEAVAMATGKPLLGQVIPQPLRVWYWCGEDPAEELERRVTAICAHYDIAQADLSDRLFIDSGRDAPLVIASAAGKGFAVDVVMVDALAKAVASQGVDVVIVDPFVSTHAVSENDNGAIDAVVKAWARIADTTNCAIELVHHARKTGGMDVTAEDGRGASALIAAVRSARIANTVGESAATKAGIKLEPGLFAVKTGKANMAPSSLSADYYKIIPHKLGNGPTGGDSVGVVVGYCPTQSTPDLAPEKARAILERIAAVEYGENSQAHDWVGRMIADVLGLQVSDTKDRNKVVAVLKGMIASRQIEIVRRTRKTDGHERPVVVVVGTATAGHPHS